MTEAYVEVEGISPIWSEAMMPCTVSATTPLPDPGFLIDLECVSPERGPVSPEVRVLSADAPRIAAGEEILLGFAGGGLFDEVLLTMRRPDTTVLLVWISAMWLPTADEDTIPSAAFIEPLGLAHDPRPCGYECDPQSTGCAFIEDPCPCTYRAALDVRVDGERRRIVDGDRAVFQDGLSVHVVHASGRADREGNGCGHGTWYQLLAVANR